MAVPFLPYIGKKGMSRMLSDSQVPWYDRPPRRFPVHVWLERRYGFRVPPLRYAPQVSQPEGSRPFPARLWLEQRQAATRT
jgi:hypothetical protein